jgi:hypothetical protein
MQTPEDEEHPGFPLEVTEEESRAGFRKLRVFGIGDIDLPESWYLVVGRPLDESDIIVKVRFLQGAIAYTHRRFGVRKTPAFMLDEPRYPIWPKWHPANIAPSLNPKDAVFNAKVGFNEGTAGNKIDPCPAEIKEA